MPLKIRLYSLPSPNQFMARVSEKERLRMERHNLIAKRLQKENFRRIWDYYKAKEDMDTLSKGNVAAHFFYLGAKTALGLKEKDYEKIKREAKDKKLKQLKIERELREIKKSSLKLGKKGLNIKASVRALEKALKKHQKERGLAKHIRAEIRFLEKYERKKKS